MPEDTMPRILIADDNPPNAELLEAHLDGTGFETKIAANGEETLAAARDWQPDVILLDVMMPKISGFEVCQPLACRRRHARRRRPDGHRARPADRRGTRPSMPAPTTS